MTFYQMNIIIMSSYLAAGLTSLSLAIDHFCIGTGPLRNIFEDDILPFFIYPLCLLWLLRVIPTSNFVPLCCH